MRLVNAKIVAALLITGTMSIGTVSAEDLKSDTGKLAAQTDTSNLESFINVKAAVASRFSRLNSGTGALSARRMAQQDLLRKSARFASNNL